MKEASTTLHERLVAARPSLTAAEQRITAVLLHDPAAAAQLTISALAERAGTSEATVARAARSLGFSGYPELRLALAAAGATSAPTAELTLSGDVERGDSLATAVEKLVAAETTALRSTLAQLDLTALAAAVAAVSTAPRVNVYGVGVSGLVAQDLWHKLMRIGRNCQVFDDVHLALTSAALLGPGDVVVAVSHSGEVIDVLEPVRLSKAGGATVVAITSQPKSSLARLADQVLQSAARTEQLLPGAMAGRASQLLVTDALFVGVAQTDFDGALRAMRATTAALDGRRRKERR
ncbi:MAG TPA: MurR/RpiR family transcriptional regulator [Ilumatobacter sp.]|nr:MurR/RpiR family transcriptional regulator [Ilumatobacter sp.]